MKAVGGENRFAFEPRALPGEWRVADAFLGAPASDGSFRASADLDVESSQSGVFFGSGSPIAATKLFKVRLQDEAGDQLELIVAAEVPGADEESP